MCYADRMNTHSARFLPTFLTVLLLAMPLFGADTATESPAAPSAPAPTGMTANAQTALAQALETIQAVCSNAVDELYEELAETYPSLELRKARGGFKKNDYRAYQWIVVKVNGHSYWLTTFYNDLDMRTGNIHTQYGRIQFWKNIHDEGGPNDRLQGWWRPRMDNQWRKLEPTFLYQENYSAKRVVDLFGEFLRECGETL